MQRCRRRRRRGRSRRAARRDERPRHEGCAPDQRRPGAHGRARRDDGGDRAGEACGSSWREHSCHVGQLVRPSRPGRTVVVGGAREAAEAFAGHAIAAEVSVSLPGRLERRPGEVRDGAHNPDGVRWLVERLPAAELHGVRLDLARQGCGRDAAGLATRTAAASSPRSRPTRARFRPTTSPPVRDPFFDHVETVADPARRRRTRPRARRARPRHRLAVPARRPRRPGSMA